MRKSIYTTFILVSLLLSFGSTSHAESKRQIGWIENVTIYPGNLQFKAKIDTGALTSSINAKNIEEFEKDDEQWVRFEIHNKSGDTVELEMPVSREAIIKRHFGERQKRYVVRMDICLGDIHKETDVTLVDREGFLYALLIGRRYLKKYFVIDPAEQFTLEPACNNDS